MWFQHHPVLDSSHRPTLHTRDCDEQVSPLVSDIALSCKALQMVVNCEFIVVVISFQGTEAL